jgi:hypothetical protein
LQEGAERGDADDGRIKWESRVTPWEAPAVDPELARVSETMATRLWRVEVDVTFPGFARGDRKFSLATVRIAEKDAK